MDLVCLRIGAAIVATLAASPAPAADIEHGKQLFIACAACHTDRPGALGPNLKDVVGRKAGAREDFRYSNPMRRADFVWNETNLREYLADPQAKVKGNRMPFGGVANSAEADDLVAYLQAYK